MRIIAREGSQAYLVDVGQEMARVLDVDAQIFHEPFYLHSLLAHGMWEPFNAPDGFLEALLRQLP